MNLEASPTDFQVRALLRQLLPAAKLPPGRPSLGLGCAGCLGFLVWVELGLSGSGCHSAMDPLQRQCISDLRSHRASHFRLRGISGLPSLERATQDPMMCLRPKH